MYPKPELSPTLFAVNLADMSGANHRDRKQRREWLGTKKNNKSQEF